MQLKQIPANIKELFNYHDGKLYWKKCVKGASSVGKLAGHYPKKSYAEIRIEGQAYRLHRVIWAYHFGDTNQNIDHINRNKLDNRIENLRLATKSQNEANTKHRKTNALKLKHIVKDSSQFRVQIERNGKRLTRKRFKTIEAAIEHRDKILKMHDGEFHAS